MRKPAPQQQGAKMSKLTPQQWQQVIKKRVEEDFSPDLVISPDLARKWNCSSDTIRTKVRKAGLTLPKQYKKSPNLDPGGSRGLFKIPEHQQQGAKTSKLTPEQWQQVIKECVEEGISPNDLARKWNCSSDTISKLSKLSKQAIKVKTYKLTPEQWQQVIKECVEEEISPNDLARKWNCSSDTIRTKVRKAGLTLPKQYKKSSNLDPGGSRGLGSCSSGGKPAAFTSASSEKCKLKKTVLVIDKRTMTSKTKDEDTPKATPRKPRWTRRQKKEMKTPQKLHQESHAGHEGKRRR